MSKINLNFQEYLELERLSDGSFFPVKNFMKKKDALSVIHRMKFKERIFPLPILLSIQINQYKDLLNNKTAVKLFYKNILVGEIVKPEVFKININNMCKKIFGTVNKKHPGVSFYKNQSGYFIGGKTIIKKKLNMNLENLKCLLQKSKI